MIPITGFNALTSPVVNYKELFPLEVEFSQPIEIQADRINKVTKFESRTKKFIYNFINKENKSFLRIEIKEKTNDGFNLSVVKDRSNESKKLFIKDPEIAQFQEDCERLSDSKNSFVLEGLNILPFVFIELGAIALAVSAGANCLQAKSMTELLKSCAAAAAAFAVFAGYILLAYNSHITANKANSENRLVLENTILNKHLTVIRAYNQSATEVTQGQLLTFVNS